LRPEKRFYPVQEKLTSESAIRLMGSFSIMHAVMGEQDDAGQDDTDTVHPSERWVVRLYYHPLVVWVFIGGMLMALGAAVAMLDRQRLADASVGAPSGGQGA
jgi:cytochrome c-type biogenesis protein CcmF